jgi:ATP-dependent Clp protease ATP-binding subunit ClpA
MFERFTKAAREAVKAAVERAHDEDSPVVRADHVAVAIAAAGGEGTRVLRAAGWQGDAERLGARFAAAHRRGGLSSADLEALRAVGIDAEAMLQRLVGHTAPAPLTRRRRHLPFANEAKKALEESLRSAVARGDRRLDEGHLLLGLLATPGIVVDELAAEGVSREKVGLAMGRAS